MDDSLVLSVSALTRNLKSLVEGRFSFVRVAGEISNLSRPASGHLYFTLKDEQAQLKVVLFRMQRRYLAHDLQNGQEVLCSGRLSVYEPRGDYQLIADTVSFRGAGNLAQAFQTLKARLAAEGLFDAAVKRPLPFLPRHITLVTSPEGAALHDFIRIARRRFPGLHIAVYPVPVQGEQAAPAMITALTRIRRQIQTDVIVLCRGGGSTEDLWAFNDEALARAIREAAVPVVSAVGHEIDFTIADFAADLRAPTPSAAAELLVPEQAALVKAVALHHSRLLRLMTQRLDAWEARLRLFRQRLFTMPHPVERLQLEVARLKARMERSLARLLAEHDHSLREVVQRLQRCDPRLALARQEQRLRLAHNRLWAAGRKTLVDKEQRLGRAAAVLQAVSPLATLSRGYAIARRLGGQRIIKSARDTQPGDTLELLLAHGALQCRVEALRPDRDPRTT